MDPEVAIYKTSCVHYQFFAEKNCSKSSLRSCELLTYSRWQFRPLPLATQGPPCPRPPSASSPSPPPPTRLRLSLHMCPIFQEQLGSRFCWLAWVTSAWPLPWRKSVAGARRVCSFRSDYYSRAWSGPVTKKRHLGLCRFLEIPMFSRDFCKKKKKMQRGWKESLQGWESHSVCNTNNYYINKW